MNKEEAMKKIREIQKAHPDLTLEQCKQSMVDSIREVLMKHKDKLKIKK